MDRAGSRMGAPTRGSPGSPPVPAPPRGRGKEQVTSRAVPGCPRRWPQPGRVTRARQWPGGLRGDAEGPRSAATAPPPRVRTAESGGEPAPTRWPTCRAERGTGRGRRRGSARKPRKEGRTTRPLLRAAPAAPLLLGPPPGRTPTQRKVPDLGRVRLAPKRPRHPPPAPAGLRQPAGTGGRGGEGAVAPAGRWKEGQGSSPGGKGAAPREEGHLGEGEGVPALTLLSPGSFSQAVETRAVSCRPESWPRYMCITQ